MLIMHFRSSVECEHLRGKVTCSAQLQQRHPAAGLDQENRNTACKYLHYCEISDGHGVTLTIVHSHPQPALGVKLERPADKISNDISVTHQDIH